MTQMPVTRKPRLGDRKDLVIEIQPSAVSTYRQSRRETTGVVLNEAEAREELEDVLRHSSVMFSSGEDMAVRCRSRRLGVDVKSELLRVRPDLVRCALAQVRRYDDENGTKARLGSDALALRVVYEPIGQGRRKAGYVRIVSFGRAEYRPVSEENGGAAASWEPLPPYVRKIALRDEGFVTWLNKWGVSL